jgi:uncharacterized membrane protein YjgN (DUF898 family)
MNQMSFVPRHLPPTPVSFSGDRGEFRRLVTRGAALELVTLGFYRFWLATDIRRHLWSNTHIDGDAAEYTGRGKELLIGFLFALAILVPFYLAYFLLSLEAERNQQLSSSPLLVLLYIFGQFAIYRARRYRLTRTMWRGVRFWMDGSGWAYAARATLWGLLMLVTLGLALPWREAALERYKMEHSYYGDLQGSFEGRGWDFFKRIWWLWLLAPVALVVFPLVPFFYAEFKARELRWWLSGIRFGDVCVESSLGSTALYGLYWKVIGWFLLLSTAFFAFAAFCGLVFGASLKGASHDPFFASGGLANSVPLLIATGIGYLALLLSLNVVMRVYLVRDLWVKVLESASVHGIEAAANVSARGELAGALGEGFADGLDVAGF